MTSALAVELHPRNIRINTIEPQAAVLSEGADELVPFLPPFACLDVSRQQ